MIDMETKSHNLRLTSNLSREKGFSLIELLTVVALIGIVAAIAYPQINQMLPGIRVNGAVRGLAMEMNLTKVKAISENRKYWIKFTPSGTQYEVYANKDGDDVADSNELVKTVMLSTGIRFGVASTSIDKPTGSADVPAEGVSFSGGSYNASFKPNGRGSAGGVFLIPSIDAASGRSDRMRAITTSSPTYKVKAYRYTGSKWVDF